MEYHFPRSVWVLLFSKSQSKCKYVGKALSLLVLEAMPDGTPQASDHVSSPRQPYHAPSTTSTHTRLAAQPHTSKPFPAAPCKAQALPVQCSVVKLELFSCSFIAFSSSQSHCCPTALGSAIPSLTHTSLYCPFSSLLSL